MVMSEIYSILNIPVIILDIRLREKIRLTNDPRFLQP